ncbi:hypothetical protein C1645_823730 [Glomus cerebriforme]|uniref:Uncharacterized protein n=1 Tax=Glomus cerebriforme TaxID=658196 RepID=A0A397T264_9GLOM|nr:hypothetical protein C1645_823730 [Glomus cerebriforme]
MSLQNSSGFFKFNKNHYYHVCYKLVQENNPENHDDYDYEFFYTQNDPELIYHIKCKLFSTTTIVRILNKKIYDLDFDMNELKHKYSLTLHQKLNLDQNLRQSLPHYLRNSSNENSLIINQNHNFLNKLEFFYHISDEDNIFHVTCKMNLQDVIDDDYDFEFFFLKNQNNNSEIIYVTCKLLSSSLVINILNKETYGIDFDVNELKQRHLLSLHQKLKLEQNLKHFLFRVNN